jgi:hypothetical protein
LTNPREGSLRLVSWAHSIQLATLQSKTFDCSQTDWGAKKR